MRLFHGARQSLHSARQNEPPGVVDPANPAERAKAPASQGAEAVSVMGHGNVTPQFAAAMMHNDLSEDAKQLGWGFHNVPLHQSAVATEGSDKHGYGGDAARHDPTGIGRGV